MPVLWVYAAPAEGRVLPPAARGLCLGVGKTAATFELTRALLGARPDAVVTVGVCGAPRELGLGVGEGCLVGSDRLLDEGVAHPGGFLDLGALGLGDPAPLPADPAGLARAVAVLGLRVVDGVTVSTCAGTEALARARAASGLAVETMEGAAIAWVCARLGVPQVALRAVSNFTGDRDRAGWDLERALARLRGDVARLVDAGWAA